MTIYKKIWLLFAVVGVCLVACKDDQTEVSTITSFEKFSVATLPTPIVVSEAEATHTINFAFDDRQIFDVTVSVTPTEASTATEGVDYDLSTNEVSVPTLGKDGSFDIHVYADFEAEGDETVVVRFAGTDPATGLPTPVESLVMTIRDSIYPVAVQVAWSSDFVYDGDTYNTCDFVDVDLFLLDSQGAFAGGFGGATASCPERMFLGSLADGDYSIAANLYDNGLFGTPDIDTVAIPITVSIFKGGVVSDTETTVTYDANDFSQIPLWTAYTPSDPDGLSNAILGTIRVGGGKVTLLDPDGNVVGAFNK